MFTELLTLLNKYEAYDVSERIEIAKGKHAIPKDFKSAWNKIKREFKFKQK